ncbi:MAG: hypothetical protein AAFY71_28115 [Bacteroidota bacterium]
MSKFSNLDIPNWVKLHILFFFNEARTVEELRSDEISDHSKEDGSGYTLGETVAQRILDTKNSLRGRRFQTFDQLDDIKGLGEDKIMDLAKSLGVPAAERFKRNLYDEEEPILYSNFILNYHSYYEADRDKFLELTRDEEAFKKVVGKLVSELSLENGYKKGEANSEIENLKDRFVDSYLSGFLGSYAFALWFMHFDEDNWFSFERIHSPIEPYLNAYPKYDMRLELRLIKGFQQAGTLAGGIAVNDLPVVVNHAEQVITIWSGQLND